jgi:prepilin-type N-terminal cleavage/methylation domain-containing protein
MNKVFGPKSQRGFSIIEVISAIVVIAVLTTGFLSAFSSVLKNSVSPLQLAIMEDLAASEMDRLLSGSFESAVAASSPVAKTFRIDGTPYRVSIRGASSVVANVPVASGVHLTLTVSTDLCVSCVSLAGDTFDVQ